MTRAARSTADACVCLVVAGAVLAGVAGVAADRSLAELGHESVLSNGLLGLALGLAAYPVARVLPRNPVGWLLLAGGLGFELSAAGRTALDAWAEDRDASSGWRLLADATSLGWPVAIAAALPLTLLLFPDGSLIGARWRPVLAVAALNLVAFELQVAAGRETTTYAAGHGVRGYLRSGWADSWWLNLMVGALTGVLYVAGLASLVMRYRRGEERTRRQVLWLLLAAVVLLSGFVVSALTGVSGWLVTLVIALVPAAIAVAVLRHQLLDITMVVSRSLSYLLVTATIVTAYVAIVIAADRAFSDRFPFGPAALATLVAVAAFNPVRRTVQRRVDRVFFGDRRDPVAVVAELGHRLGSEGLVGVLEGLCGSLRLPWARLTVGDQLLAAWGEPRGLGHEQELSVGGEHVGSLTIGLRSGERALSTADQRLLGLMTAPLAVAVQATTAADELREARRALVTTREEERRRLGRDLHDELGPMLTGISLQAEAARRLSATRPEEVGEVAANLRDQALAAVEGVRALARGLRPGVLDSLGLTGAMKEYAGTLAPLRVIVEGDPRSLPAAIEVAAYRIATEALTNVVRHADAELVTVSLEVGDGRLTVSIVDDGGSRSWGEGVGLASMRERVSELGGTFTAGPQAAGGTVRVTLPYEAASW